MVSETMKRMCVLAIGIHWIFFLVVLLALSEETFVYANSFFRIETQEQLAYLSELWGNMTLEVYRGKYLKEAVVLVMNQELFIVETIGLLAFLFKGAFSWIKKGVTLLVVLLRFIPVFVWVKYYSPTYPLYMTMLPGLFYSGLLAVYLWMERCGAKKES